MVATVDELQVQITANANSFNKQIKGVQKRMDEMSKSAKASTEGAAKAFNGLKIAAVAAVAAISVAVGKMVSASTKQFGDFEQNVGGAKAIFGDYAGFVQKKATEAASTMGMSMNEYMQTANKLGAIIKGTGMSTEDSLTLTAAVMQRAADQASVMGVSTAEAMDIMVSAGKGILTTMDGLGVKLSANAIESYALSQGVKTTYSEMSEAQKAVYAYGLFLDRTKYAQGNFAREGVETLNGSLAVLKASFKNLGTMLGSAFAPILMEVANFITNYVIPALKAVIPYVIGFMQAVGKMVSYVANALAALFGKDTNPAESISGSVDIATDSMESLGGATSDVDKSLGDAAKSAKKLKNQLASFDEMNVLTEPTSSSDSSGSGVGGTGLEGLNLPKIEKIDWENIIPDAKIPEWLKGLDKIFDTKAAKAWGEAVKKVLETVQKNFQSVFSKVGAIASTLWEDMGKSLEKYGDQLDTSLANWGTAIGDCLSNAVELAFAPIDGFLGGVKERLEQSGQELTDSIMVISINAANAATEITTHVTEGISGMIEPIRNGFSNLGELFTQMWIDMTASFAEHSPEIFGGISQLVGDIIDTFSQFGQIIAGIWEDITGGLKKVWDENGKELTDNIALAVENIIKVFQSLWDNLIEPIVKPMLEQLKKTWDENLKPIVDKVAEFVMKLINFALMIWNQFIAPLIGWLTEKLKPTFENIGKTIAGIMDTLGRAIGSVVGGIIDTFSGIIDFLTGVFTGDWKKAWEGIKGIFSGICDALGGLFKAPINFIIDCINTFIRGLNNIKIPDWVPAIGGAGFHINEIPKLAHGGVIDSATIAMIGESGREAVLPLERNTGWMDKLAEKLSAGNQQTAPQQLVVQIGDDTIFDKAIEYINNKSNLQNRSVIAL